MASMLNTTISQPKNPLTLMMKMKLQLMRKKMMKVVMKVLMMTPIRTQPEADVVAVVEAGDLVVGEVNQGEGGDADAQLDEEAQDLLTRGVEDVVKCTEDPEAIQDHCRQVRLPKSNEQATTAHSLLSQLLMIDMVHLLVLVVIYDVVVEQLVASRNENRSLGVVSLVSRSQNMMMKMKKKMNPSHLDADLAEDVVLRDVDAIQLRPETMISI